MPFNASVCPAGVRRPMLGPNEMDGLFNAMAQRAELKPRVLSADPWVLQFDSWTSIAEARALADALRGEGFIGSRELTSQLLQAADASRAPCRSPFAELGDGEGLPQQ